MSTRHVLYRFFGDLLFRFPVGVVYDKCWEDKIRLIAHDVTFEAHTKLIRPLCERYGYYCNFFHDDHGNIGRSNVAIPLVIVEGLEYAFWRAVRDRDLYPRGLPLFRVCDYLDGYYEALQQTPRVYSRFFPTK